MGRSSRDFIFVCVGLGTSDFSPVRGENGGEDGEVGGGEGEEEEGRGVGGRFEGGWWMSAVVIFES